LQNFARNSPSDSPINLTDANQQLKKLSGYLNECIIEISKEKREPQTTPLSNNEVLRIENLLEIYDSIAKNLALIIGNDTDPTKLI
jgi:hypothetical protein